MNVTPIRPPLDGEQVLAVDPPLQPRVDAGWRRRLNLFTGRSLDATALAAEQLSRAARAVLLAQAVTPGIVAGLAASLAGTALRDAVLDVAPGLGITAYGEDVRLPRTLHAPLANLQVDAPVVLLDGGGAGTGRRLGPTLGELLDKNVALPPVLVLVLQPVLVEEIGGVDPGDPCERDPQSEAFEDQRTVDACRPILYAWPTDWLPLPAADPAWRNRLAWAVFERARLAAGQPLPWEETGLPLALVGTDEAAKALVLDRFTVARIGGRPRARTPLLPAAGDPALWQARVQQLAEHLADLLAAPGATIAAAAGHFALLPPAGLLPSQAATFARPVKGAPGQGGGTQIFFPAAFRVGLAPVPLDELETILDASAPLAPLDVTKAEEVQILVPVPGALYEPELLIQERVDPEFATTLASFQADRNRWLGRREDVRVKARALTQALGGTQAKLPFPETDPDAQTDESPAAPDPAEDAFGTVEEPILLGGFLDPSIKLPRSAAALKELSQAFLSGRFQSIQKEWDGELLAKEGLEGLIRRLAGKISQANDKIDLSFLHLQTEIYRVRQILLGSVAGTRLATSPVLADIAQGESVRVTQENIAKVFEAGKTQTAAAAAQEAPPQRATFVADTVLPSRVTSETLSAKMAAPAPAREVTARVAFSTTAVASPIRVDAGAFELTPTAAVPADVRQQTALPGVALDFRNLSIAERLSVPPAQQAKEFALANQLQILSGLDGDLGLVVDDLPVRLYKVEQNVRKRQDQLYKDIKNDLATQVIQNQSNPTDADESSILGDAVVFQEASSVFLRQLEGRVQLYQAALDACREVDTRILGSLAAARQRLGAIDRELAEARHDVTVALALLAEETQRVAGINDRRQQVLANHVPFLAYHRPRVAETLADTPVRSLAPPPPADPVPALLAQPSDPPAELREMVELLRKAPLRWFRFVRPLVVRFDRPDVLLNTLQLAQSRAVADLAPAPRLLLTAAPALAPASPAAEGTQKVLTAQRQTLVAQRTELAQLDLTVVARQTWKGAADVAGKVLALGDLVEAPHFRADVARLSARELEDILRVATGLWAGFATVLPALRLDWVERLSQFDSPFDLRRLSNLPRWGEIDVQERRTLQALVDWLFQRIDGGEPQAVAAINDLVRVCLLLASHAPVDRIVAGRVAEATPIRPGVAVPLVVDVTRVSIGMHVVLFSQEKSVARGVVEDLGNGRATARVLTTLQEGTTLDKDARAEFASAAAFQGETLA
jgi:hypothetical protein